jgi:hypothetical protein
MPRAQERSTAIRAKRVPTFSNPWGLLAICMTSTPGTGPKTLKQRGPQVFPGPGPGGWEGWERISGSAESGGSRAHVSDQAWAGGHGSRS